MKPIRFLGDALKCLKEFPPDAQQDGGYQLDKVQRGQQPDDFKPMPAIGTGHVATAHRNRTTPLSTMHQGASMSRRAVPKANTAARSARRFIQ